MSEYRAAKSGIARDVQAKLQGKYDIEEANKCMEWIKQSTGMDIPTSGDMDEVYNTLRDGHVLSMLISRICPGKIREQWLGKPATMPFKQMEQIQKFLDLLKSAPLSIPEQNCFATPDLFEKQNMVQVITCIQALGRRLLSVPTPVQGYGKKEAEANHRQFTEEQLKQGQNVIGLQMGSNKGASQAGQNFGKGRHITD